MISLFGKNQIIQENKLRFKLDLKIKEDQFFIFEYLLCCKKILYIEQPYYCYFQNNVSISHSITSIDSIENSFKFIDYINDLNLRKFKYVESAIYRKQVMKTDALRTIMRNIHKIKNDLYERCISCLKENKELIRYVDFKVRIWFVLCRIIHSVKVVSNDLKKSLRV